MSLADIKAKINSEAQSQIKTIEAESDGHIAKINRDADQEIKALQDTYKNRLAKEEPEISKRREMIAKLDAEKVDLGVKQRLVGETFDGALHIMSEMPKDKYLSFVQALMEKAVQSKEEIVFVGKGEKYLDQSWVDFYNSSHAAKLSLSGERLPISGGFVLRNERIDINCSWDMLVKYIRPEIESDVVKKLFP